MIADSRSRRSKAIIVACSGPRQASRPAGFAGAEASVRFCLDSSREGRNRQGKAMNITLPSTLVGAVVAGIISIADTPPKFDPAPACKAAAAIDQSMDLAVSQSYESCMNDEESARAELVKGWNTYPADAKPRCVGEATDGGLPSYVELLECFLVTVNVGGNDPVTPPQGNKKKNQKTR